MLLLHPARLVEPERVAQRLAVVRLRRLAQHHLDRIARHVVQQQKHEAAHAQQDQRSAQLSGEDASRHAVSRYSVMRTGVRTCTRSKSAMISRLRMRTQ